jgi:SpoVK/Ycf46/Vps4 family AAA+-type ATPase
MAMLNTILNGQIGMADRLAQGGFRAKAIEFIPKIRKTAVEMAESSGLRNPGDYYPPITDEELAKMQEAAAQPPGPPPEVMIEQMKGENAKALKQVDAQVSMQEAEMKAQGDVVRNEAELQADMMTADAERRSKIELEAIKQQNENARFFAKLQQERELALLQIGMQDKETGETGEDGEPVKKPVDNTTAMLMDGLNKLGEMVGGLAAHMSAPTEIVRGPDGRAVGTRKVLN